MLGFTWGLAMALLAGLDKDLVADMVLELALDLSLGLVVAGWLVVLELELCLYLDGGLEVDDLDLFVAGLLADILGGVIIL